MYTLDYEPLSSEFSTLLSNAKNILGLEQLFSIAFVLTVETGFIPTSLAEHFNSINSNNKVAKMINNNLPLNKFWHYGINNIYTSELIMSNQLCILTGVPTNCYQSLIITLSFSNMSKCTVWPYKIIKEKFNGVAIKYKNEVTVPMKCDILSTTTYQFPYPSLNGIPAELIVHIMSHLSAPNIYTLMRSCKKIHNVTMTNQVWKELTISSFPYEVFRDRDLIKFIVNWRKYYFGLKRIKYYNV